MTEVVIKLTIFAFCLGVGLFYLRLGKFMYRMDSFTEFFRKAKYSPKGVPIDIWVLWVLPMALFSARLDRYIEVFGKDRVDFITKFGGRFLVVCGAIVLIFALVLLFVPPSLFAV